MANGCIPKPTFWTFVFYKKLKEKPGRCIYRDDTMLVMQLEDGSCRGVAWNMTEKRSGRDLLFCLEWPAGEEGCLELQTVDEVCCNPLKVWHDLGEPASLDAQQLELLRSAAWPFVETRRVAPQEGKVELDFSLRENGVVYFSWNPCRVNPDRGYSYERVMQYI